MPHAEFLKLVQMVDANRKVAGQDVLDVRDEDVTAMEQADALEVDHLARVAFIAHEALECAECAAVRVLRAARREILHARNVDFPFDVWESPMTLPNSQQVRLTGLEDSGQSVL